MFKLCGVLHTNTTYSSLFLFLSLHSWSTLSLSANDSRFSLKIHQTLEIHVKTSHNKQETKCQLPTSSWPVRHWAGPGLQSHLL